MVYAPTTQLRPDLATFEELDLEMQMRGYIATRLFVPINVGVQSGTYGRIKLDSLLAAAGADTRRTSTSGYNRGDYDFEDASFTTREDGWEEPIDDREAKIFESFFDVEQVTTLRAWEHLCSSLEARVLKVAITDTEAAGRATAAQAVWTDPVNAEPIKDVEDASQAVYDRTGLWPDTLTLSRKTYRALRNTDEITSRMNSQGAGERSLPRDVTLAKLAEIFDLRQVLVSDAIKNIAKLPKVASVASIFPNDKALVSKVATTADMKEPCQGRIIHWGGDGSQIDGEGKIGVVETYRDESKRSDIIRVRQETEEHDVYPEMAEVITGTAA